MSEIQLLNSLLSIDEKVEKLKISTQEKLKDFNKLRKFLRTQLKNHIDKPKYEFIPYEDTKTAIKFRKKFNKMSDEEKAKLEADVKIDE
ncbi:hypothetical protein FMM56_03730 [Campylobacter sp. LR264d]|uniref:hypothetical protein n=1 Tax=Campylobacter sp. LR264d TaxID=2593544 RepID=UPI00123A01EB|nr:hypothetical protein [Campylobacter sp. LR264d]KAA6231287.1 hypothetical protein FMM56_03730 [Campylobacter sp. LR264d]